MRFYDALDNNEAAVRMLNDETLREIAHEMTESLPLSDIALPPRG